MEAERLFDCRIRDVYLTLERHRPADWNYGKYPARASDGLIYIVGGTMRITEGETSALYGAHELVYIPQGTRYSVHAADDHGLDFFVCNFNLEANAPFVFKGRSLSLKDCDGEDRIARCYQEMANACLTQEPFYALRCRALFYNILYEAAKIRQKNPGIGDSRVYGAIRYMREHFSEPIGIGEAAEAVGLSPTHFRRLFEEETGKTPRGYLQMLRIQRAKALLCGGQYTVGEVAQATGFSDIYYFSRAFKRETGYTPTRWRQMGEL